MNATGSSEPRTAMAEENRRLKRMYADVTAAKMSWGFGLCFLYLRNVQGHGWNHKRVYRIYRELELNLRSEPSRRHRFKPDGERRG